MKIFAALPYRYKLETLGVETPKGTPSALQPSQKLISRFFNMEMTETENDVDANAAAASVSISFSFHLIHDEKNEMKFLGGRLISSLPSEAGLEVILLLFGIKEP